MKVPKLVATPPGVMIVILLVIAAVGTVAVTCVAELTTNAAVTSPNVTFVVCVNPVPLMTTCVPTGPLVGLKLEMVGSRLRHPHPKGSQGGVREAAIAGKTA